MKLAVLCYEGLDGLSSAAIVSRMAHMKKYQFSLRIANYQTVQQEIDNLKKERNSIIFVLDFPPTEVFDLKEFNDKFSHITVSTVGKYQQGDAQMIRFEVTLKYDQAFLQANASSDKEVVSPDAQ